MATDISIRLGEKIRELRKANGWRQIDLAAHAELSKTHIHDLEVGRREIGLHALEKIANALNLKPSELLKEIGS